MKRYVVYITFLISCFPFFGQEEISSIKDTISERQIETLIHQSEPYLFTQIDSARFYLDKGFELAKETNKLDFKLFILNKRIYMDGYHYLLEDLNHDIRQMDSIIQNDPDFEKLQDKQDWNKLLLSSKGNYYFKLHDFSKAGMYFEELLTLINATNNTLSAYDTTTKRNTWLYLASIHRSLGKYQKAKEYYNLILADLQKSGVNNKKQIIGVKYRLSKVFMEEKRFEEAKALQLESMAYLKTRADYPGISNTIKTNYAFIIDTYIKQDSTDKALTFLKESTKWVGENDPFQKKMDILAGDIFTKQEAFEKAGLFYQKALAATKEYRNNQKHQDIAKIYSKLGKIYNAQGFFDKSLVFYQKGLQQLSPDFESNQLADNPAPEKVFSKLLTIKLLREKLTTLHSYYHQKKDVNYLDVALQTSFDLVETLDVLKPEFESKVDKQFLLSEMYPAFQEMIEVAYTLYAIYKDTKYIEDAFHFMEKSKSILLLEATRNAQAASFGNVPDYVLNKEQQYRAYIINLEKKAFNQKENPDIVDSLFRLKNQYDTFLKKIEGEYPKYHDLKYKDEVTTIKKTIESIGNEKALLHFFLSEKKLFMITAERNNMQFYKIPFDTSMEETCKRYYEMISKLAVEELPEIYNLGNRIYKAILEKPLSELRSKELICIPDGVLNYIPFESLSVVDSSSDFLIKTHQISYANSCTLLLEQKQNSDRGKNKLVAYAPHFGDQKDAVVSFRSDLGPLLFNTEEAKTISDYFSGKAVTGKAASLQSFKNDFESYTMFHFATHAAANDEFPDYSYLAFSSEKKSSNFLYVKDLYAYNLDADLVTLSACQTGIGKLQRGEGMLSLARGFTYAGAKSLVTTLWKINDQTTATLMKSFYKNISQSEPKDKALREAKLEYLQDVEDEFLQHPYYWSGFMITGNTEPLTTNRLSWWWLLLLAIPVVYVVLRRVKP